jgi:hypothetical protein
MFIFYVFKNLKNYKYDKIMFKIFLKKFKNKKTI